MPSQESMMNAIVVVFVKLQVKFLAYLFLTFSFLLSVSPASGCRYTVRELGFSDLLSPPYRLVVNHNEKLSQKQKEQLAGICRAGLVESNIEAVTSEEFEKSARGSYVTVLPSDSTYACLVSPDTLIDPLILNSRNESLFAFLSRVVHEVSSSPVRKMILADLLSSHAVILLFAGADQTTTAGSRQVIDRAVEQIAPVLPLMPKPAAKPPRLIEIPFSQRQQEKVLMWSLGLAENFTEPALAILYGRGRQMGPLLQGAQISDEAIYAMLSLVGADCECDLDRSYLHGVMIPLIWSEKTRARLTRTLGFDAENPLVKMEMYRIAKINMTVEGIERLPAQVSTSVPSPMSRPLHKDKAVKTSAAKSNGVKSYLLISLLIMVGVLISVSVLFILFSKKRRSTS